MRVVGDAPQVALEVPDVHGIEPHERGEQAPVGLGDAVAHEVAPGGQARVEPLERGEQVGERVVVRLLRGELGRVEPEQRRQLRAFHVARWQVDHHAELEPIRTFHHKPLARRVGQGRADDTCSGLLQYFARPLGMVAAGLAGLDDQQNAVHFAAQDGRIGDEDHEEQGADQGQRP